MASNKQIIEILTIVAATYGQEPGSIDAYLWALEEFDQQDIEYAARECINELKWLPKPVEIRDRARAHAEKRRRYWGFMGAFNESLGGRYDYDILERSPEWQQRYSHADEYNPEFDKDTSPMQESTPAMAPMAQGN